MSEPLQILETETDAFLQEMAESSLLFPPVVTAEEQKPQKQRHRGDDYG